jgi:phage-related protein
VKVYGNGRGANAGSAVPSGVQQPIGKENRWTCLCLFGHTKNVDRSLKPLNWIASAKKDLMAMPDEVQQTFGFALYHAQIGSLHPNAKPLRGFGSAGVLEAVEDWRGDTYRAVYTVRFADAIFVLHCVQKKSKRGIQTPKREMDLIRERLREAEVKAKGGTR